MSIGPSIGGHDPYGQRGPNDPLYLAGIQRDKGQEQEESFTNPKSKLFALVAATLYLKKFIDQFVTATKSLTSSINTEKILVDLAAFKNLLEELAKEDKSHIPEFTQRLSLQWQKVSENCSGLEGRAGQLDLLSTEIMNLFKEIHHFPPGEDHTLGYYLAEHAGQDWIPFPFMNILHDLHEEGLALKEKSQLFLWIHKINEILSGFR
jgi:hypothetical protein